MDILFLTFLSPHKYLWGFQFGPGYLSAVLKQRGHKTTHILDSNFKLNAIEKIIHKQKTDLICVSTTTNTIAHVKEIIPQINQNFDIPIIIGGVHATVCPEESIQIPGIFGVCRGEGELALSEFVEHLEGGNSPLKTRNFWFKHKNKVIRNPVRPLINDLDPLPFPDRENFDYGEFLKHVPFGLEFSSSRGCPFNCAFCINSTMRDIYNNPVNFLRRRSVDNFIQEIKEVTKKYSHVKHIYFHDDVFTTDKDWLREFSMKYSDQLGLPFRVNVHANFFDEECAIMLKDANCSEVELGIETGDEALRIRLLGKNVTNSQLVAAFKAAHKVGLSTRGFNMLGLPYETEESLRKTLKFNEMLDVTHVNAPFFRPYPRTRLYDLCLREGLFRESSEDYQNETMLKLPTVPDRRLYFYKRAFNFLHKHPWAEGFLKFIDDIPVTRDKTVFDLLYYVKQRYNSMLGTKHTWQFN